jgi:hypothetical protein
MPQCSFCKNIVAEGIKNCPRCGTPVQKPPAADTMPAVGIPDPLRDQMAAVVGRPIGPNETAVDLLRELVTVASARSVVAAGAAAGDPRGIDARPPTLQPDARVQAEHLLDRPIAPDEKPRDVLAEAVARLRSLEQSLVGAAAPPPGAPVSGTAPATGAPAVPFPAMVSKLLNFIPRNFQWLAALVAPLLLGGGSAYFAMPARGSDLAKTQNELQQVQNQKTKAEEELASKTKNLTVQTTELTHLREDNERLRANLSQQGKSQDTEMEKAHKKNTDLETKLADAQNSMAMLRPFAEQGFVEWEGVGSGTVTFNPSPSRGRIIEGAFPTDRCFIADVPGQSDLPSNLGRIPCSNFALNIKGAKANENRRVKILWRRRPA